jgi:NAD(P)-dependent dehydrogenase (short-subunit alcohol dehydrogenase family)
MGALNNRRVLVTGVTSGIGKCCVDWLIAEGAEVFGLARDEAKLAPLAKAWGERFHALVGDLADGALRRRALSGLSGELHGVVNNAAECVYEPSLSLSAERWRRLFEINVLAAVDLMQALRERIVPGGDVVNVSSVVAAGGQNPRFLPYATTKAVLSQLTESWRVELAPRRIRVSEVRPGLVDTEIYRKVENFQRAEAKLREVIPQWLRPADVAEAVGWILTRPPHVVVGDLTLLPLGQS